jgi:arylsulfatase A-like enzyme
MNIITIIIDTLRYDCLGANGNTWIKTPNLDRLAGCSWVFDRAFAASYPTIPHRTDVMTGRYGGPFHRWKPLDIAARSIPRYLGRHGYATQLIHDTPHLVNGGHAFDFPFNAWTFVRGAEVDRPWFDDSLDLPPNWQFDPLFDEYLARDKMEKSKMLMTYIRANRNCEKEEDWHCARLFNIASRFLRDNAKRENFFLWLDCFDPHESWDSPPRFVRQYIDDAKPDGTIDPRSFMRSVRQDPSLPENLKERLRAYYAAKVSHMDECLGGFLDALETTGLSKNTAVVLTADHGTNLGEAPRFRFGKSSPPMEAEAHVPLMIRHPDGDTGRSDIIVQPQDIFATVTGLAGLPAPANLESHDVLRIARERSEGPRRIALAGGAARPQWAVEDRPGLFSLFDNEWQLTFNVGPEDCALRRLGDAEDIAADNPEVVERLHARALAELEHRGAAPELMQWLRTRGETEFPTGCRLWDGLAPQDTWKVYWTNLCEL